MRSHDGRFSRRTPRRNLRPHCHRANCWASPRLRAIWAPALSKVFLWHSLFFSSNNLSCDFVFLFFGSVLLGTLWFFSSVLFSFLPLCFLSFLLSFFFHFLLFSFVSFRFVYSLNLTLVPIDCPPLPLFASLCPSSRTISAQHHELSRYERPDRRRDCYVVLRG